MEKYEELIASWAENDAYLIKIRGEGRQKWRDIRWATIRGWKNVPLKKRLELYSTYKEDVETMAPKLRQTAPKGSKIVVSM